MTSEKDTARKQMKEEAEQLSLNAVIEILEKRELYYVGDAFRFFEYSKASNRWFTYTKDGLVNLEPKLRNAETWKIFIETMAEAGRSYSSRTYSFNDTGDAILNQMRKDHWLKPKTGRTDFTKFFDYLLYSIGGGKEENILHIKRVIGRKYKEPQDWQLPCLCFYGAGGSGKTLLSETILAQIFGDNQVVRGKMGNIERFNGFIIGKSVVCFDEQPTREDQSSIKFLIGNPTIFAEEKNLPMYTAQNTPLYIIATNEETGPVRIENNGTERRFSFIKSELGLLNVIAEHEQLSVQEVRDLMPGLDDLVWRNPEEVAYFLGECVKASDEYDGAVRALHGEDFDELKDIQIDVVDQLCDDIMLNETFKNICLPVLYDCYKIRAKNVNPGASPLAMNKFSAKVIAWAKRNELRIRMVPKARVVFGTNDVRQTRVFFSDLNKGDSWKADYDTHMMNEFEVVKK